MAVSRLDLDGKGAGSPEGLVLRILKAEPGLTIPVPIERLCRQLDIEKIEEFETDGFEGGLVTDINRSRGVILARPSHPFRRRFTIAHELGHFLLPTHIPDTPGRFLCSREDMRLLSAKENDRRSRMEVEANRFASLILIPPPLFRPHLRHDPDVVHMAKLANDFEVSKEAMARAYAHYHDEVLAFVFTKDGKVRYPSKNLKFPFLTVPNGASVPAGSLLMRQGTRPGSASEIRECTPDIWINVERGVRAPTMYEQVLWQRDGFAVLMLWLEPATEADEEDNEDWTAKQRYERQARR
jgi:Zn-dependent peptidase ImmA (M78 family)